MSVNYSYAEFEPIFIEFAHLKSGHGSWRIMFKEFVWRLVLFVDTSNEDGSESTTPEKERKYSTTSNSNSNEVTVLTKKVDELRSEVSRLRKQLKLCQIERKFPYSVSSNIGRPRLEAALSLKTLS